jgi:hypothetical protein
MAALLHTPTKLALLSGALLERPPVVKSLGSSQHFMEPEGSLPHSQELSTSPYPEPDQSSPPLQDMLQLGYLQMTAQEKLRSGWPGPLVKVEGCPD